ncbi:MAG: hypothetical protein B6I19_04640 [Bacteroidetes bacterium 4572_114]|nr:MAG: hypothetical protein B6I19_04640 [Bacteroidetes bacterium 4572_114]
MVSGFVEGMQSPIPRAFGNEGMASLATRISIPFLWSGIKPLRYRFEVARKCREKGIHPFGALLEEEAFRGFLARDH